MKRYEDFPESYSRIKQSLGRIDGIGSDDNISNPYIDEYTTKEQQERDKSISELLALYVKAYKYKNQSNKVYKIILFAVCILSVALFGVVLAYLMIYLNGSCEETTVESIIQLVTVSVTFVTLIVSILKIITKYVFPVNDEEYITRIVELIQNNDLKNKQENIRVKSSIGRQKKDRDAAEIDKDLLDIKEIDEL